MQIDLAYAGPPLGVEDAARRAVAEGYGGLWTSESKHDPFLTLALASRVCPQLTIGSGIAVALARSPFTLAQSAWDLAQLSEGRFILGLGSQVKAHITKRFSMPWDRPVGQMREMVAALRAIWQAFQSGEPLKFEGKHYRHTLLTPNFSPGPGRYPRIPLGLAAVGPQMTALAGEVADLALLHPFSHPEFVRSTTLAALGQGLERAGRVRASLDLVGTVFAFVDDDHSERRDLAVRQKIAFYGSTPAYHGVLESLGRHRLGPNLHALSRQGAWSDMGQSIDDELMDMFRLRAGTLGELFDKVRHRYAGLYDRVILTVPGE
jgi:probable F420-dependent oxidoreductase